MTSLPPKSKIRPSSLLSDHPPPLWEQLAPDCQREVAQLLAILIQRQRKRREEKPQDDDSWGDVESLG